jgi:hypothetical protein
VSATQSLSFSVIDNSLPLYENIGDCEEEAPGEAFFL